MVATRHQNEMHMVGHDGEAVDRNVRIVRRQCPQLRVGYFARG